MTLNGHTIPSPITPVDKKAIVLEIRDRVASGKAVTDIKAVKIQHTIKYQGLTAASFTIFNTPYQSRAEVAYVDDEGDTYTVQVVSLRYSTHRLNTALKQNVTVVLEEV
jgi:hypothetical protein